MDITNALRFMVTRAASALDKSDSSEELEEIANQLSIPAEWAEKYKDFEHLGDLGAHTQTAIFATNKLASILHDWDFYYGHNGQIYYDNYDNVEVVEIDEPPNLHEALKSALKATTLMQQGVDALFREDDGHAAAAKSWGL